MTEKNQTQIEKKTSIDDIVLAKRFGLGWTDLRENPKKSLYALDALDFYKERLTEDKARELNPWISALMSEVQANKGIMPSWAVDVFSNYASIYGRLVPEATVGDISRANQELGYNGYIPEELLSCNIKVGELQEKVGALQEKKQEELTEEQRNILKLVQAFQILENAGNISLRYTIDSKNYSRILKNMYPIKAEEQKTSQNK